MKRRSQSSGRKTRPRVKLSKTAPIDNDETKKAQPSGDTNMKRSSSTTSYIQEIPDEVLASIFQQYVDSGGSPWCLTLVSDHWRVVALAHPGLWSYLFVNTLDHDFDEWTVKGSSKPLRTEGMYQSCSTGDELRDAISRSGNVKLTVRVGGPTIPKPFDELIPILFEPSTSSRIKVMDVFLPKERDSDMELGDMFTTGVFSSLRILYIIPSSHPPWIRSLLSRVEATSEGLEEFHAPSALVYPFVTSAFWRRIRMLTAKPDPYNPYSEAVNEIVSECPNLTLLKARWRSIIVGPDALTNIRTLEVECKPSQLSNLNLPNLQTLLLEEPSHASARTFRDVTYPELRELHLESADITWLTHFTMPKLSALYICTYEDPFKVSHGPDGSLLSFSFMPTFRRQNFERYFSEVLLSSLRVLTIDSSCDEDDFVSALDAVPNVISVHFIPRGDKKRFGEKVLERLMDGGEDVVCEQLRRLTLGMPTQPVSYGKTALVRRTLNARAEMGKPLKGLDIYFYKGKGDPIKVECVN